MACGPLIRAAERSGIRRGSHVGAHVGPRGAMSIGAANGATERKKAPGWRPGPEAGLGAALPGVACDPASRIARLAPPLAPGSNCWE
jgi:hypothetical protein